MRQLPCGLAIAERHRDILRKLGDLRSNTRLAARNDQSTGGG
jgi:hypothetical protein